MVCDKGWKRVRNKADGYNSGLVEKGTMGEAVK